MAGVSQHSQSTRGPPGHMLKTQPQTGGFERSGLHAFLSLSLLLTLSHPTLSSK